MIADRGESPSSMEPMLIPGGSRHRAALIDLAIDLVARASGFRSGLQPSLRVALAALVRTIDCHASLLIEGRDLHPIDIERALHDDLGDDPRQRALQLEARAHVEAQAWLDAGGLAGRAATAAGLQELHRRLGEHRPADPLQGEAPGALRSREVDAGPHEAASPGAVPRLLAGFERAYAGLGRADAILAIAPAHHRLLWIRPFAGGNGRVARLMSHALLLEALDTGGTWSLSRGLARSAAEYRRLLSACDPPRLDGGDGDGGRGARAEEALADFTAFFFRTCLDQVELVEGLLRPEDLRGRVLQWAAEEARAGRLPERAGAVLEALLSRGELARGEVPVLLGQTDRNARRIVGALAAAGAVEATGPREPLRLALPAALAARWMPGLFPDRRR